MKQLLRSPQLKFRKTSGPSVDDPTEDLDVDDADTEAGAQQAPLSWTGASATSARAVTFGLLVCLLCGPLALAAFFLARPAPVPAPAAAVGADPDVDTRAAASAFAEDLVVTWLTTPRLEEKRLEQFGLESNSITLSVKPWIATDPTTAGIAKSEDGRTWAVTVAVTVATTASDPGQRRYFLVPVAVTEGSLAARTLPTPVAAPATADAGELGYRYRATTSDQVGAAAQDFLTALLVAGNVDRFIAPDSEITAVLPAPYSQIEVDEILLDRELEDADANPKTGRTLHLLITAVAAVDGEHQTTVQYALTMRSREGRWEASSIDAAPLLWESSADATGDPGSEPTDDSGTAGQPSSDPDDGLGGPDLSSDPAGDLASPEPSASPTATSSSN
jgi:hypothetical protein